jgi:SPP1 gp7 family putative phage head morphogenesis protein
MPKGEIEVEVPIAPAKGEELDEWMNRCSLEMVQSGVTDDENLAAGLCQQLWEQAHPGLIRNNDNGCPDCGTKMIPVSALAVQLGRVDPTHTQTLRNRFVQDSNHRYRDLAGVIWKSIVDNNALAIDPGNPAGLVETQKKLAVKALAPAPTNAFDFATSSKKVNGFMDWLDIQEQAGILEISKGPHFTGPRPWSDVYIQSAYKKGMSRSTTELQAAGIEIPPGLPPDIEVDAAFNLPIHADRVGLAYTRTFTGLKGISEVMDVAISNELASGLASGMGAKKIASNINKHVRGIGKRRATVLARTEVIRAHHGAMMGSYRAAGLEKIKIQGEWRTAGDKRVCPKCEALDGKIFPLDQIENSIPLHPQCRCIALPWNEAIAGPLDKAGDQKAVPIEDLPNDITGSKEFGTRLNPTGGSVGGSTGAQVFADSSGQEWIVKFYDGNELQVQNEWIANQVYALNKISVPEGRLVSIAGQLGFASKRLDDAGLIELGKGGLGQANRIQQAAKLNAIKKGFVNDAFLANWDTAGTGFDNIMLVPGSKSKVWRIDQGGTLSYRAQGAPKGAAFGDEVLELTSLRDADANSFSARLFSEITDEDISSQIATFRVRTKVTSLTDILSRSGMPAAEQQRMIKILEGRLQYLDRWRKEFRAGRIVQKALTTGTITNPSAPVSAAEAQAVSRAGARGHAIAWDRGDIEDQQVLFWTETGTDGITRTFVSGKLRGKALTDLGEEAVRSAGAAAGSSSIRTAPATAISTANDDFITAIKGLATRSGQGYEKKDFDRVAAAKKALKDVVKEIKATGATNATLLAKDAKAAYQPWIDEMNIALDSGEWQSAGLFERHTLDVLETKKIKTAVWSQESASASWRVSNFDAQQQITKTGSKNTMSLGGKAYTRDLGDGIDLRLWYQSGDEGIASLHGQVNLSVAGTGENAMQDLLKKFGDLGVQPLRPSGLDVEELYLIQILEKRRELRRTGGAVRVDITKILDKEDQAARVKGLQKILNKNSGIKDVTALATYNPSGVQSAGGRKVLFLPDELSLAEKPAEAGTFAADLQRDALKNFRQDWVLHAKNTGGDMADVIDNMLSSTGGMASTVDKSRAGILIRGMSPGEDMTTGGGNYVFTRLQEKAGYRPEGFSWKANQINRLDAITYDHDLYGKTKTPAFIQNNAQPGVENWRLAGSGSSNETIFKNQLSLFDDLENIVVDEFPDKKRIIEVFKKHGITKWPDGRSLDRVVRLRSDL